MGFRAGSFAKVWEIDQKGERWTKLRISISKKDQETGEYKREFGGVVDVFGTAAASKAAKLKEGDRIKLVSVDLTNSYDAEKRVMYWNPIIYDFEMADEADNRKPAPASRQEKKAEAAYEVETSVEDDDDSGLPF